MLISLKKDFSHLTVAVNGGVKTLEETLEHLEHLDGVMVGREAYQNPYILAQVDQQIFGLDKPVKKRTQVVEEMYPYIEQQLISRCLPWSYYSSYAGSFPEYAWCTSMASLHQ